MREPVVVRIAPSPTGDPHVGTAYTCLFNYALRRKRGGKLILRIDDTDRTRYRADSEAKIVRELEWLGFSWDEGPCRQSERLDLYRQACETLIEKGAAYRCECTAERLARMRAERNRGKEPVPYDGRCRERDVPPRTPHVVRLKVPREGETTFADGLRGAITIAHANVDDQVLLKSDGYPTFHLATVVDDHHMGITHVLRAEEWLSSMPKQVLVYEAFGWDVPHHFHLPLLRNPDRSKISKRRNPASITWYREHGFLPEALVNFLALMGFSLGDDREEFSLEEFVDAFEPESIKTSTPVFDLAKLEWLNGVYLRKLRGAELVRRLKEVSPAAGEADPLLLQQTVPLVRERLKRLTDFDEWCAFFFADRVDPPHDALIPRHRSDTNTAAVLRLAREIVARSDGLATASLEAQLRRLAAEVDWKPRELFMSLRYAITGKAISPPIVESMVLLGKAACIERIDAAIDVLGSPENPILGPSGAEA
ncbi:MAG: glutamate--tRNA ligase [Planctomycetota bacterium]|jgi:glutamyl-tRNA synthetase